jgi:hypothetical protein
MSALRRRGAGSADSGDCGSLSKQACDDATAVGTGIGIAIIIVIRVVVDFLVGITYLIWRLARR